jgi:protein SCO1/2
MRALHLWFFVLMSCTAASAANFSDIGYTQKIGAVLPFDTILLSETGQPVRLGAVAQGRPILLALVYYRCPNLCGTVLGDLMQGLADTSLRAGRDYTPIVLSIDPAETAQDAAASRRQHFLAQDIPGAAADWHFLTGPPTAIDAVESAVGFHARFDAATKQFLHPAGVVAVTPAGRVSGYVLGVGYRAADLATALTRAAQGAVSPPASPILLLCWHYDPVTGRYTFAITRVLQLGAILTVLVLGGVVLHGRRRA